MTAARDALEQALAQLLAQAQGLQAMDLRARLQWLEDTALAAEQADLGDAGALGARDLKAALGAVLKFSQGPMDEASLTELEAIMRALTTRGLVTLCKALSLSWAEIAGVGPRRAEAHELAVAYDEIARALARGAPVPERAIARIADVAKAGGLA